VRRPQAQDVDSSHAQVAQEEGVICAADNTAERLGAPRTHSGRVVGAGARRLPIRREQCVGVPFHGPFDAAGSRPRGRAPQRLAKTLARV
jgi:hypothetical protein